MTKLSAKPSRAAATGGLSSASGLMLAAVIAIVATTAIYLLRSPAPLSDTAPADSFSAERALQHLNIIAARPHPIGSEDHERVRDYIVQELSALGLKPEVQKTTVVNALRSNPYRAATVENILARLPGASALQPVLLVSHYDSVQNSPGASDDGAGVVALLETARALKASPPLKKDVLLLFTDGEEAGLLGAQAFVREHAAAKDIGVVFNFEGRGSGGPSVMFETSDQNGWLIREFAGAAPNPVANSLSYEIYKRLPNDTDLTVFKKAGYQGLNFAYIDHLNRYHTAADTVENLDQRSLQGHGSYALALARHFGNLDGGPHETTNAVYFNLLGPILIHYRQWLVRPLAALAALLFIALVAAGLKRGTLRVTGLALGFAALLLNGIASWLAVTLAWKVIAMLSKGYDQTPWGDLYNSRLFLLSFVFLTIAVSAALYNLFRRRAGTYDLMIGGLLIWVILAVATSLFLPAASYIFVWPLLFTLVALLGLLRLRDEQRWKKLFLLAIYAVPGIILISPLIGQMVAALTLASAGTIMLLEVLLLILLLPHLELLAKSREWLLPGVALLLAAGLILVGLVTTNFDRRHPRADNIFYVLDADTQTAAWGSTDQKPDEWTAQFLGTGNKDPFTEWFPLARRAFLKETAPTVALAAPEALLLNSQTEGEIRMIQLRLTSKRRAALLSVYTDANEVVAASIDGKPVGPEDGGGRNGRGGTWALSYYAIPEAGADLTLSVKTTSPVKLRIEDRTYGLPQINVKPINGRPDYIIPTPSQFSDVTIVTRSYSF